MSFLVSTAYAAGEAATATTGAAGAHPQGSQSFFLIFIVIFFAFFYFMMIRPQTKRQKLHRQMLDAITKGDEVVLGGGIMGKVTDINEGIASVEIAQGVEIKVQKASITSALPKGTIK